MKHFNFSCSVLISSSFGTLFCKGQDSTLVFQGHVASVATTQLCYFNSKTAMAKYKQCGMCLCAPKTSFTKTHLGLGLTHGQAIVD